MKWLYVPYITYRTRTKFHSINFRALAGSEFRGSIFSCGVIFVSTRCSRSEINFQLRTVGRINFEDKKFRGFRGYLLNLEIKYPRKFPA